MANQSKYQSYDQVPIYRRQWFFWLTYILIPVVPLIVLLCGDIYYIRKDEVKSFGPVNRAIAGLIALGYIIKIINAFIGGNPS